MRRTFLISTFVKLEAIIEPQNSIAKTVIILTLFAQICNYLQHQKLCLKYNSDTELNFCIFHPSIGSCVTFSLTFSIKC